MIRRRLNNLTFRTHMMVSIGTVVFLAFAITIASVSLKTSRMAKGLSMDKAKETAYRYGNRVEAEIQVSMDTIRAFSSSMEGMVKHRDSVDRTAISDMLRQVLRSNDMFKGIWCVFEPDMLDGRDAEFVNTKWHDGSGMFYPYFYKKTGPFSLMHATSTGKMITTKSPNEPAEKPSSIPISMQTPAMC